MRIPRVSALTLGVADLERATAFYEQVFATPPNRKYGGVTFIELPGTWVMLYPLDKLAEDIGPQVPRVRTGFSGITLAYNARTRADVDAVFARVAAAGATIAKPPHDTFWGGYSGYFADLDGHYWEVAWGPTFQYTDDGALKSQA